MTIVELRKKRMTQARIAQYRQISKATVSRVFSRAGLSKLTDLDSVEPVQRYEHERPGDQIHIDTKKLGRIENTGHRATGEIDPEVPGGRCCLSQLTTMPASRLRSSILDETQENSNRFLANTHAYFCWLGVRPKALLTDNGSAFRAKSFKAPCDALDFKHRFTRPYRPQTNGKAERFIQSALREWAYGFVYKNSKTSALTC